MEKTKLAKPLLKVILMASACLLGSVFVLAWLLYTFGALETLVGWVIGFLVVRVVEELDLLGRSNG